MKTLFIPAKSKLKLDKSLTNNLSKKLPQNIAIAYSIQYKSQAEELNKILKPVASTQVLGCSQPKFPKNTKAILLISDGKFHATSLAMETKLPTYILENNKLSKISSKDIEVLRKKQKAAYVKFLNSKEVGIIISTKPGQQRLKRAMEFKKKLKSKHSYLFICNNINTSEFENFGLDSWVNTACPRLDMNDARVVNIDNIK
ncbi:2-(3-amino-3-carboxypropyl)histidine synthase [Candidatus Pacearchaeota archaeon]|nr:2-(3-amino-3-carboxypropyl)histidine synthase [Candidatus Pacearchaeota archaeon]